MWASSIIAKGGQTFLYLPTTGGIVLAPEHTRLFCAYAEVSEEEASDDQGSRHTAISVLSSDRVL